MCPQPQPQVSIRGVGVREGSAVTRAGQVTRGRGPERLLCWPKDFRFYPANGRKPLANFNQVNDAIRLNMVENSFQRGSRA